MTTIPNLPEALVTPADGDLMVIRDIDDATNKDKKITWANIKATLKTYQDTLYVALTGDQTVAGVKTFSNGINLGNTTLTNYRQDTWTPALTSDGTPPTLTYGSRAGTYTRVGNMVYFWAYMNFASYTAGTGVAVVNLPLSKGATITYQTAAMSWYDSSAGARYPGILMMPASTSTSYIIVPSGTMLSVNVGVGDEIFYSGAISL